MEGQIMRLKNEQNRDGHFRLSEQEGLACTDAYNNAGCMGGLEYNVWDYMIDRPVTGDDRRRGMCQDSDYPYTGIDSGCERTTTHEKAYGITGW